MKIIAAITNDRALGRGGDMIYHISDDLRRFKALTMGHPIIMGRKTFESFPKGALPGRRNIVITRNSEYSAPGIETFPSLDSAIEACADTECFVIGGAQVYAQAIDKADTLVITEIDAEAPDADAHFPAIDGTWTAGTPSEWHTDARSGVRFRYIDYTRNQ